MAKVLAEPQTFDLISDPYLYLANVKAHLADHRPMTEGDEDAWGIVDAMQVRIVNTWGSC